MYEGEGDIQGRVGGKRLVGNGEVILSMGLVSREVRILAQRATTPSKEFFFILIPHMCFCTLYVL